MKNKILRISILPLIVFTVLSFTDLQQQGKGNKGNKGQDEQAGNGKNQDKGNNKGSQGNNDPSQGNNKPDQPGNKGKDNDNKDQDRKANEGNDRSDKENSDRQNNAGNGKMNKGERRKEVVKWDKDDNIDWNFSNFASRKHPKDQKKVTICHNTGNGDFPVTINVSENALQAHLNHGDQQGNCNVNYADRWPRNYILARETVYNTYQNTWETMSYSEALIRYAAEKLLGIKTNLDRNRSTFTVQEVQRREALILDLQNNVNSLENQLNLTRQRADNVNIIIQL